MSIEHIIILLITGIVVGFAAGLLGLGGGFFMTPVQFFVYTSMGLSTDIAIKLAFGTTLLVILPTAISGALMHTRRRAVWWRPAIIMGVCSGVASYFGATISANLPGPALKIAFGVIALLVAIRMLTARPPNVEQKPRDNVWLWIALAIPIGIITGILGIGGGVMVVPVMVLLLRFGMHRTVGTSLGMMIFTTAGGVIGYIVQGLGLQGLPAYSLGYVNLPAFLILTISSIGLTPVGTLVAHKLAARKLQYIFIIIMFYVGLRMVGFFEWLGLPL